MQEFKILKLLDKLQFLYLKLGVDYPIMRKILQIKLLMDERRVPTVYRQDGSKKNENFFKKSLLMYGITGLFITIFTAIPFPLFYKMNFTFGILIFMVMSVMISDYSSVLLDVQEKSILLPKPINSKTINAAKVTHIIFYLFTIILVIAGPSLVLGSFRHGLIFGGIFLFQLVLVMCLVVFLTAMLYFFVLQFFDGEKLKDMINFFQITLAISMMLVYQLIGRIFEIIDFNVVFTPKWWTYLLPSTWFAAPFMLFVEKQYENHYLVLSALGIIVPLVLLIVYFKGVAPYFERNLQKLNNHSQRKEIKGKAKRKKMIASLFCFDPVENSVFRFTQNILSNERSLKLKLYPTLAFAGVIPLVFMFRIFTEGKNFEEVASLVAEGKSYLLIYVSMSLLATSFVMLNTSEKYKSAWIYQILPIQNPSIILKGAIKGFIVKLLLPVYLLISLVFSTLYGYIIIPHLVLMLLNMILLVVILFHYSDKRLPFSQDFEYIKHNNVAIMFKTLPFSGISAAIHGLFINKGYPIVLYILFVVMAIFILWKKSLRFTWADLLKPLTKDE